MKRSEDEDEDENERWKGRDQEESRDRGINQSACLFTFSVTWLRGSHTNFFPCFPMFQFATSCRAGMSLRKRVSRTVGDWGWKSRLALEILDVGFAFRKARRRESIVQGSDPRDVQDNGLRRTWRAMQRESKGGGRPRMNAKREWENGKQRSSETRGEEMHRVRNPAPFWASFSCS